jgi:AbrB family looped-hinge helix DNA binding protein
MSSSLTSKGQVTVPKPIRECLGLRPGSRVVFEIDSAGRAYLRAEATPPAKPSRFAGLRGSASAGMSTEEIMRLTRGRS